MAEHSFGGDWTTSKLRCLDKYLRAYTKIVNGKFNEYIYIDAFAGTGWLTLKENELRVEEQPSLFSLLESPENVSDKEIDDRLDGSARIALKVTPAFSQYFFIEKDIHRFRELQKLREEFPEKRIVFENSDANVIIQQICRRYNWLNDGVRAVLFLDPYGMQVSWETIELIAETQAIDLWYLFPLGVALNRLLKNDGNISDANRRRIDAVLGTSDWYDSFYTTIEESNLLGSQTSTSKTANSKALCDYFMRRLDSIFSGVASNPRMLLNSKNNPLYLLCFASANPKGSITAIKIAQDILRRE